MKEYFEYIKYILLSDTILAAKCTPISTSTHKVIDSRKKINYDSNKKTNIKTYNRKILNK